MLSSGEIPDANSDKVDMDSSPTQDHVTYLNMNVQYPQESAKQM